MNALKRRILALETLANVRAGVLPEILPGEDDNQYFIRVLESGIPLSHIVALANELDAENCKVESSQ